MMGDMLDHALNPKHPLRATEPAKGGRALGMRAQTVTRDLDRRQKIGIVSMQHGPVRNRQAQVLGPAAADEMREPHAQQPAVIVKPHLVSDPRIVPFARDHEVVIAIRTHFAGAPRAGGGNGTSNGQRVGLALFTAKSTTHAADLDPDSMHRHAQSMGHFVLHFRRVLG